MTVGSHAYGRRPGCTREHRARRRSTGLATLALALALGGVAAPGCSPDPEALSWSLAFSDETLASRVDLVQASILNGGCDSSDVVYSSRFAPGEAPPLPPELRKGTYGFSARVRDRECRWYAEGCVERRLPLGGGSTLRVELTHLANDALDCSGCGSTACSSKDAAQADAAVDAAPDVESTDAPGTDAAVDADAQPPFSLFREAESADSLTLPLVARSDPAASGEAYITYPFASDSGTILDGKRTMAPSADETTGIAHYELDVPAGRYRLWARVVMATLEEDSFWIRMDDGAWFMWNDVDHGNAWTWAEVRDFATRQRELIFDLTEGRHTLYVSYRELNAKVDVLLITSDLGLVPMDPPPP